MANWDFSKKDWRQAIKDPAKRKFWRLDKQKPIVTPEGQIRIANLKKEKEKFFSSKNYSPQFQYKIQPLDLNKFKSIMDLMGKAIQKISPPWRGIYQDLLETYWQRAEIYQSVGNPEAVCKASEKYWGKPKKQLVAKALKEAGRKPIKLEKQGPTLSPKKASIIYEKELAKEKFDDWQVKIKTGTMSRVLIIKFKKLIVIDSTAAFTREKMIESLIHELVHLFRYKNGLVQSDPLFVSGFPGYLRTEEGLAAYCQRKYSSVLFWGKFREVHYLVVDLAYKTSFREIYDFCRDWGMTSDMAWDMAVKCKRFFGDTSKPGAYTRQLIYTEGMWEVENFVENGGKLKNLFVGKVRIRDLPLLKTIKVKKIKFLPSYLMTD